MNLFCILINPQNLSKSPIVHYQLCSECHRMHHSTSSPFLFILSLPLLSLCLSLSYAADDGNETVLENSSKKSLLFFCPPRIFRGGLYFSPSLLVCLCLFVCLSRQLKLHRQGVVKVFESFWNSAYSLLIPYEYNCQYFRKIGVQV